MKKLKVGICALVLICSGLLFAGCNNEPELLSFDANQIVVGEQTFTYDGNRHIFEVSYPNVTTTVTYSLDNQNFVSGSELNIENAGRYNVYYKISAEGYNDYISSRAVSMTINKKSITLILNDVDLYKSQEFSGFSYEFSEDVVDGDVLSLNYIVLDNSNIDSPVTITQENAVVGKTYTLTAEPDLFDETTQNYNIHFINATATMKDVVEVESQGQSVSYYSNIKDAVENAQSGDTIYLNNYVFTNETIDISKSLTIDGRGQYYIVADTAFTQNTFNDVNVKSIFHVVDGASTITLTLKDLILDGNDVARGVSAMSGKLVLDNATISKGNCTDGLKAGGVYIGGNAEIEMNGGSITNSQAATQSTSENYSKDLCIDTTSDASIINGGSVRNLYVASGKLTVSGGDIVRAYVAHVLDTTASLYYRAGNISNLMVSMVNNKLGEGNPSYDELYTLISPVQGKEYIGGRIVYATESTTEFYNQTFDTNIDSLLVDGSNYVFDNCTFTTAISSTKKVGLTFNNCTFTTGNTGVGGYKCIYLTSITYLVVNGCTFSGTTTAGTASSAGYALDLNLYSTTCENIVITNNVFDTISSDGDVAISIKTRLGETDNPSDGWNNGENTEGIVYGTITINANAFEGGCNNVYLGTGPKGSEETNTSSGNFNCEIANNADALNVYLRYTSNTDVEPVVVEANGSGNFGNLAEVE